MPKIHAVVSAFAGYRAVVYGEGYSVSLAERYDFDSGLHARPLLGEHKFSTRKIPAWFR
jgi:hypothetical protein